jgi:hypothetical protein
MRETIILRGVKMSSKRLRLFVALWITALAPLVVGGHLLGAVALWRLLFPGQAFDPVVWHDEAQARTGVRSAMADRLIVRGTLLGKTRAEVLELLGEPTEERRSPGARERDLVYELGPERRFISIDSEFLLIHLDQDGRVVECTIVTG